MSTPEFDKFDLEGLSLEDMSPAPAKAEKPDVPEKPEIPNSTDSLENILDAESAQVEEIEPAPAPEFAEEVGLEVQDNQTENAEDQMTCPKCELQQPKAEQCSDCGIYVEKALAQIGKSKIQITGTKY